MDANIKSVVDYKVCEPKKMPKHEHITVTIWWYLIYKNNYQPIYI
jgi:hypothetical protein